MAMSSDRPETEGQKTSPSNRGKTEDEAYRNEKSVGLRELNGLDDLPSQADAQGAVQQLLGKEGDVQSLGKRPVQGSPLRNP